MQMLVRGHAKVTLVTMHTVGNPANRIPIRNLEDAVIYEDWSELVDVT